jgi:hypothetical protein
MEIIKDCLNNQFLLYDYFETIDSNLVQYLDNNNLNINFYCIVKKEVNSEQIIVTSNTTKNKEVGYKLIIIKYNVITENKILSNKNILQIYYENIYIQINSVAHINDNVRNYNLEIRDPIVAQKLDGYVRNSYYSKYIDETKYDYLEIQQQNINLNLFKNLTEIVYRCILKIPINFLPSNLRVLEIFNNMKIEEGVLPNLEELVLGDYYDKYIGENVLPESLKIMVFGESYWHKIKNDILPSNLRELEVRNSLAIGHCKLPNNLSKLVVGRNIRKSVFKILPLNLRVLHLHGYPMTIQVGDLPPNLEELVLGNENKEYIREGVLPESLKILVFGNSYNREIRENVLPKKLEELVFGDSYYYPIKLSVLPVSLRYITISRYHGNLGDLKMLPNLTITMR